MPGPITLYTDVISPYAYVAYKALPAIAEKAGREIVVVPVLFAALLNAHGQKGPAEIPAKRVYTFKDAYRKARAVGLPGLVPPPSHPFNPLLALRAASTDMDPDVRRRFVDALFDAVWKDGTGLETPEAVAACARRVGLDADAVLKAASEQATKDRLRAANEKAIAEGAFGVPTMVADGELFWGVDALPHLALHLEGKDTVPTDAYARWGALPASAARNPGVAR
jgi:2-hydroxychromene-2-carboxylate isomerase